MRKGIFLIGFLGTVLLFCAGGSSLAASKGEAAARRIAETETESESETETELERESRKETELEGESETETEPEGESETETELEGESETETELESESETETEDTILYAPDLVLNGTVVGGYAGNITLRTDDGKEYEISFANAKTDFSDSGLYEGMEVKCVLEDIASDEEGIFTAKEITRILSWE